jgi:predicted DNA-binding protein (MmcQ/YjbR family)
MDEIITDHALSRPGTFMTEQWRGAHVFKVGTRDTFKMFAILRPGAGEVTVKASSPEVRQLLIEVGVGRAHSHLPRGNWIVLLTDRLESDDVCERITASYTQVLAALPKRISASLQSG